MNSVLSLLLSLLAVAHAVELTSENYDDAVAGKTVLIKFQAPWWGHCKKMKPDWDKLMDAFADSETALVGDVDCTAEGKSLCETNGIKGYPSIKWGDPANLEEYKGGRDYASLEKFATENLKPVCSPSNIELCDDDKKATIEKFLAMAGDELDTLIAESDKKILDAEEKFKKNVEGLQAKYQSMMDEKEKAQEDIKNSGLGLMKACKSHASKSKGSDEL